VELPMRAVVSCAWALVVACSFRSGVASNNGGDGSDQHDAPLPDSPPGETCFAQGTPYAFCVTTPIAPLVLLSFHPLDTGMMGMKNGCAGGSYVMVGSSEACVLTGTTVTLANATSYVAVHDYPLVIAATGEIDIAGVLDVSTTGGAQHGAGNTPMPECAAGPGLNGMAYMSGAGGGAGGSFGTAGGAGGSGDVNTGTGPSGIGGTALAAMTPTRLRGGCPSGGGGNGAPGAMGGHLGVGGGAVLLATLGQLTVSGTIDASGEHGYGGDTGGGGGAGASGGASGGMIALAAGSYSITGVLIANGGGGGGGGGQDEMDGAAGSDGSPVSESSPQTPAAGGSAVDVGGQGGAGAATAGTTLSAAGDGASVGGANGGGGGGGGGEGVIGYIGAPFAAPSDHISPAATAL
jgi:hypothetical protein